MISRALTAMLWKACLGRGCCSHHAALKTETPPVKQDRRKNCYSFLVMSKQLDVQKKSEKKHRLRRLLCKFNTKSKRSVMKISPHRMPWNHHTRAATQMYPAPTTVMPTHKKWLQHIGLQTTLKEDTAESMHNATSASKLSAY